MTPSERNIFIYNIYKYTFVCVYHVYIYIYIIMYTLYLRLNYSRVFKSNICVQYNNMYMNHYAFIRYDNNM